MNNLKRFLRMISLNVGDYLWMIFIFSLVTCLYDYKAAIVEFIVFLILLALYQTNKHRKRSKLYKYINNLDIKVDDSVYNALTHSAIPIVIIKRSGIIEWCNEPFMKLASSNNVYKLPISDYIKGFDINSFSHEESDKDGKIVFKTVHNGRSYRVLGNILSSSSSKDDDNSYYIALYWYDNT